VDLQELKKRLLDCIDKRSDEIAELGRRIYDNPETGYKEFKTANMVADKFRQLGVNFAQLEDIPGLKMTIDTGREGPGLAVLGELDAIVCREHPHSDRKTGAVHACGHNAQIAAMIGTAMAILDSEAADKLSGKIHFIAVPAEEYIEIAYRIELRKNKIIKYLGGKPELLYRGWFDDVDLCIKIHSGGKKKMSPGYKTQNGCIVKRIRYIGRAAHAGGSPHSGINALYAANIGLMAINSIRETFKESDYIRVHPIITKGGDVVNVIPSDVRIETYIRGKTIQAIEEANRKVDRALVGGAIALGAQVEIEDIPGYFPCYNDTNLQRLARKVMVELSNEDEVEKIGEYHGTGSTDMGDLSTLMPVLEAMVGGVKGGHSQDYEITDPHNLYIMGTKLLACLTAELLYDDAAKAKEIVRNYVPLFKSKEEYFKYVDGLFRKRIYNEGDIFK